MTAKVYKFDYKGKTLTFPSFTDLPMGVLRKARKAESDLDKSFIIIEELIGEDSPEMAALDKMTGPEFKEFVEGWTQGAPLGESLDS